MGFFSICTPTRKIISASQFRGGGGGGEVVSPSVAQTERNTPPPPQRVPSPQRSAINHLLEACCRVCNGNDSVVMVTGAGLARGCSRPAWLLWVSGLYTSCKL